MEVRNCKKCNALFNYYSGYPLCPKCKVEDEREFRKVRDYIKSNPGVNIEEVSNVLEISRQQIIRYVKEERLEIYEQSSVFLICEMCGCNIRTGRYCSKCKEKLEIEIKRLENEALAANYYNQNGEEITKDYVQEQFEKKQKKLRYLRYGE